MNRLLINKVIKFVAILGAVLACQSSFAGVGIYMSVTNGTEDSISIPVCRSANIESCTYISPEILSPNQTQTKVAYREVDKTDYSVSIPVYVNQNNVRTKVCDVNYTATTYFAGGPKLSAHAVTTSNFTSKANEANYQCKAEVNKDSKGWGDTDYISVTIIPGCLVLPPLTEQEVTVQPGNYCPLTVTTQNFVAGDYICFTGTDRFLRSIPFSSRDGSITKFEVAGGSIDLVTPQNKYGFSTELPIKMWKCTDQWGVMH